jgi:cyclase
MKLIRIVPSLLIKSQNLCKGKNFDKHVYVGDVFNALKIFSEKRAHEIILMDIDARKSNTSININLIKKIRKEIFIPLCVGGGINDIETASKIINEGVEKIIINASTPKSLDLISLIANKFGSQSATLSIDVVKNDDQYFIYSHSTKKKNLIDIKVFLQSYVNRGAGEVILTAVHKEGTGLGYDIDLYKIVENAVSIPIIASGGAQNLESIIELFDKTNLSAAAVGNSFIYFGSRKAVLINYPSKEEINKIMEKYENN